jgi:hypothetical protein
MDTEAKSMTDTDTPRTTAPAMEGDALTAEQVDYMAKRIEAYGIGEMRRDDYRRFFASHRALRTENAALRDRLARAEERERLLRGLLRDSLIGDLGVAQVDSDTWYWQRGRIVQTYHPSRDEAIAAAIVATPTDGAAPPRRSAEGNATGGE